MAMGADYSFELVSIEIYVPQFIGHNKFFLGSVNSRSDYLGNLLFFCGISAYNKIKDEIPNFRRS